MILLALLGSAAPLPAVRLDQLGFEARGAKTAIVATDATAPLPWTLTDAAGHTVATGRSVPFGPDPASGTRVHRVTLPRTLAAGQGYRLTVGSVASRPFPIADRPFAPLARQATTFFYQQRSGTPILAAHVQRPDLARPAGHSAERVTCFDGTDQRGVRWPGCDYTLDVTGGWYDAGDHGKYVVNGGISTWTLLDLHERLPAWGRPALFADGTLPIPEAGNRIDDLLDEARVEVEFLLAMQIPDGKRVTVATVTDTGKPASGFRTIDAGGMAHTKVADIAWTGLPLAPHEDRQPRRLYPPSTAATLNLAAVAAQAARIWRAIDPAFAARAQAAAIRAWNAAERNPAIPASSDFAGSGGYGDKDWSDERFWAAAQLLATTGEARFRDVVEASPHLAAPAFALSWGKTDFAGLLTLATDPQALSPDRRKALQTRIVALANGLVKEQDSNGYGIPFAGTAYGWGSNSELLNRAMLLGTAWQITRDARYRDAVVSVIDYLLGRNPLDQSYVTGLGARPMMQPHHRFWAHAADPRYPLPPPGVVSGGPNSTAMNDEVAAPLKGRCTGQTCWVDDWRSYTMNEVAINWNAPLVWAAAFLDATAP
ncbi:glycoside hydrolase family 9 protein [Sphingomonas sp.]|uniref:glycoside hydrolase family 9 protein n=1 Tax=Sphingomonas sp. TaxID=28214 RepID=UPI0035B47253